ncbi:MAG TPA: M67 family metallopeptidase [Anaerolineales bacterium]|nr:M67 family metallopeptidase [Anaerolineales bacterium]
MQADVSRRAPEEACGLVAGRDNTGVEVIPVTNALHSPVRYRMDPNEQLEAFNRIEELGLEIVAIYHSHPSGPSYPSPTDVGEAFYPEAVYLIWFGSTHGWDCRGFLIREAEVEEIRIEKEAYEP